MTSNVLVVGASRGIGAAVVRHFSGKHCKVFGVSRTEAHGCHWIQADVTAPDGIARVVSHIGTEALDALIFAAGVWESYGFSEDFDFRKTQDQETHHIMSVNLLAPIALTKAVAGNLSKGKNPRAIYLGALSAVGGASSPQVAYVASKFGLRGAVQALQHALQGEGVGFTTINPGNVATDEVLLDIREGRLSGADPIPLSDILSTIDWIMSLSAHVGTGDIDLISKP